MWFDLRYPSIQKPVKAIHAISFLCQGGWLVSFCLSPAYFVVDQFEETTRSRSLTCQVMSGLSLSFVYRVCSQRLWSRFSTMNRATTSRRPKNKSKRSTIFKTPAELPSSGSDKKSTYYICVKIWFIDSSWLIIEIHQLIVLFFVHLYLLVASLVGSWWVGLFGW